MADRGRVFATASVRVLVLLGIIGCPVLGSAQERTVADGVYTVEQGERGRMAYVVFCAHCHASDLSGDNTADSGPPPLRRDGFWEGSNALALFTKVRQTMPLEAPGALTTEQYLDILAYVFQQNGFPEGAAPLTPDEDLLRELRITGSSGS